MVYLPNYPPIITNNGVFMDPREGTIMEIKQNDLVEVDGKTAKVCSWWGQGKTLVFHLEDGRHVHDLHKMVQAGVARVVPQLSNDEPRPLFKKNLVSDEYPTFEDLPDEQEDFEE